MNSLREAIISGFADEINQSKNLDQQFSVVAALGMEFFSIRFVEVAGQIKNAVDLQTGEIDLVRQKIEEFGLRVACLGSPIGKVKLVDQEDGTANRFIEFSRYLDEVVRPACEVANRLETQLIRGFSFYPPKGAEVRSYLNQACDQLGAIVEAVAAHDLIYGVEVEANLVGHNGWLLTEMARAIDHPNLSLVFDGGNLVTQGYSREEIFEQYLAMKPHVGGVHVKDYLRDTGTQLGEYIDEDALSRYVPATQGDSGYGGILADLASSPSEFWDRFEAWGLPGLFLDLEPHLKGGGQFGGVSGPDGFGLAFRALTELLQEVGLAFQLRDLPAIKSTMEK